MLCTKVNQPLILSLYAEYESFMYILTSHAIAFTKYPMGVYTEGMKTELKKRAVHRSKIIEGQMKGLQKMIQEDAYCMDILTQSLAIQKSLASLDKLVLRNHLETHVADMMGSPNEAEQEKAVKELLDLYELNNIRGKNK